MRIPREALLILHPGEWRLPSLHQHLAYEHSLNPPVLHIITCPQLCLLFSFQRLSLQSLGSKKQGKKICDPTGFLRGFPGSSAGKESTCSTGDPSSIPGLGRSPGEGIGYPLQYSSASMVAQMVKNLLEIQETWVNSRGQEDPLEKGMAMHSSIPTWKIPWTEEPDRLQSMKLQRVRHDWVTNIKINILQFIWTWWFFILWR